MRKTQSGWRRHWSRKWLRKFIAINLAVVTASCGFACTWAAGPGKKTAKAKATEKVARKTDDEGAKSLAKDLPKSVADNHPLKPLVKQAEASLEAVATLFALAQRSPSMIPVSARRGTDRGRLRAARAVAGCSATRER